MLSVQPPPDELCALLALQPCRQALTCGHSRKMGLNQMQRISLSTRCSIEQRPRGQVKNLATFAAQGLAQMENHARCKAPGLRAA
jgi:hypothetical protein